MVAGTMIACAGSGPERGTRTRRCITKANNTASTCEMPTVTSDPATVPNRRSTEWPTVSESEGLRGVIVAPGAGLSGRRAAWWPTPVDGESMDEMRFG